MHHALKWFCKDFVRILVKHFRVSHSNIFLSPSWAFLLVASEFLFSGLLFCFLALGLVPFPLFLFSCFPPTGWLLFPIGYSFLFYSVLFPGGSLSVFRFPFSFPLTRFFSSSNFCFLFPFSLLSFLDCFPFFSVSQFTVLFPLKSHFSFPFFHLVLFQLIHLIPCFPFSA